MGAIQKPTPQMGPYKVEIRSGGSFYLHRAGKPNDGSTIPALNAWTIPAAEIPNVLAAFDQASAVAGTGRDWGQPQDGWTVDRSDDTITIAGPWAVYCDEYNDDRGHDVFLSADVEFRDVPTLRTLLTSTR